MKKEDLIKKQIKLNRRKLVADIILIIIIVALAIYIITEIEAFKTLGKDVCKLCMEKTGSICYKA